MGTDVQPKKLFFPKELFLFRSRVGKSQSDNGRGRRYCPKKGLLGAACEFRGFPRDFQKHFKIGKNLVPLNKLVKYSCSRQTFHGFLVQVFSFDPCDKILNGEIRPMIFPLLNNCLHNAFSDIFNRKKPKSHLGLVWNNRKKAEALVNVGGKHFNAHFPRFFN